MGSSASGNYGGQPTVERCQSRIITVSQMLGRQDDRPRQGWRGSFTWTDSYSGEASTLTFVTTIDREEQTGFVDLEHDGRDKIGGPQSYRVHLQASRQPLGGLRWWFWCPREGGRVCKLYLPRGAARFASRKAYRLAYQCQRETPRDRAYRRAWKRRQAMGGQAGKMLGTPIDKPPRRHWSTWDRDETKMAADVAVCDRYLILSAIKLGALKGMLAR